MTHTKKTTAGAATPNGLIRISLFCNLVNTLILL